MGQPLGPTFANIFMCFHEQNWLEQCSSEFAPILYKRYIDDNFVLFKDKVHVHLFLNYLNSEHTSINFTIELENNNKLPFLNCLVTRDSNQFCSSVYRKPTFSGLSLSFFSYCPSIFKINRMKTLIKRVYAICSNYVSFDIELNFLQQYFSNNGYPIFLFDRYVKEFLSKLYNSEQEMKCSNIFLYIKFPYFGPQSDKLKFELSSLFIKYLSSDVTPRIILNNRFTLSSLFQHADKLPTALRSSVVCKFSCMQCMSVYIGSTCRRLHTRVSELARVSPRTDLPLSSPSRTAILNHITACKTNANLSNFQ